KLFSLSPLAETDIIVSAIYDSQVLLLKQALAQWPGVEVVPARDAHGCARITILSFATSSWADFDPPQNHLVARALTSAQEGVVVVHSQDLFTAPPARAHMFPGVARLMSLLG